MIVVVIINIIAHRICLFFFCCLFSVLQDDFLVSKPVKQHLAKYDKQLKKFNVSQALDTALAVRHKKQHYRQQLQWAIWGKHLFSMMYLITFVGRDQAEKTRNHSGCHERAGSKRNFKECSSRKR